MISMKQDFAMDDLSLDELSLDQAQALKDECKVTRESSNKDLESLMNEHERIAKDKYVDNLHGFDRWVAQAKEIVGRGREYSYKRHLEKLSDVSAQLTTIVDNTNKLRQEYDGKMRDTRQGLYEDRKLFDLNVVIYTEKDKQLQQAREKLKSIESQSVLGSSCTTQAMQLSKDVLDLENDLMQLNCENDELAVNITVKTNVYEAQKQTYQRLQQLQVHMQKQKAVFSAYHELAQANEQVTQGVRGVRSAQHVYMLAATMVQQLKQFQNDLQRTAIEELPKEFVINSPKSVSAGSPTRPYWMSVAEEIRKSNYRS